MATLLQRSQPEVVITRLRPRPGAIHVRPVPNSRGASAPRGRLSIVLRSGSSANGQGSDDPDKFTPEASAAIPSSDARKLPRVSPDVSNLPQGGKGAALESAELNHPPDFVASRLKVFLGILAGYTCSYLNRLTLTYAAPIMVADKALGITKADIGAMTSAFPMAYGVSKFVGGMLGAAFSPRVMLAGGLIATSLINIAFGFQASVVWWTALWALNGALQGIGAPACAMLLTRWFAAKERGTYWGLWNIATNMGGFLAPVVVGTVAKNYGWKWGMWAPGAFGLVMGTALLFVLKDKPEDAGYPPVEAVEPAKGGGKAAEDSAGKRAKLAAAFAEVVRSPAVWLLAVAYFFVYMVRQGSTSWLVFYLLEVKGAADAGAAALTVSGLELGGLLGGTLSGWFSDKALKAAKGNREGQVGKRVQIVMAYTAATLGVLALLRVVPATARTAQWLVIALLGFCIYGPQMLIGLCGAEVVAPSSVGASQGILGLISYIGAANAGIPLAHLQQAYGWNGYFAAMAGACCLTLLLLAPLANAKSYVQLQREKAAAA